MPNQRNTKYTSKKDKLAKHTKELKSMISKPVTKRTLRTAKMKAR